MDHIPSNLSPEEEFSLTGTLRPEQIEKVLDNPLVDENVVESVLEHVEDIRGNFPKEDFLSREISRLDEMAKRLRGANREELMEISYMLDRIERDTFVESEEGRIGLKAIRELLGEEY
jgi:hypothetical protein